MTQNKKQRIYTIAVFVILVAITIGTVVRIAKKTEDSRKKQAQFIAQMKIEQLRNGVEEGITSVQILGAFIETEETVSVSNFDDLANRLYHNVGSMSSIFLAPNGVVNDVYPSAATEDGKTDFLNDSRFSSDAEYASKYQSTVLSGPFVYDGVQNTYIILQPIYRRDSSGVRSFWGFVGATISMDSYLETINITDLSNQGYDYILKKGASAYSSAKNVAQSASSVPDAVSVSATLSNEDTYTLSLTRQGGWLSAGGIVGWLLIGLLIAFLITLMFYSMMRTLWMSNHDMLTGLLNMRSYYKKLRHLQSVHASYGIMYLDLNGFKQVNDNYGHSAGDRLLVVTAMRMQEAMRRPADGDLEKEAVYGVADRTKYKGLFGQVYRLGGDEFSMILPGKYTDEEFERIMNRVLRHVNHHVSVGNNRIKVSTSIGYAKTTSKNVDYSEVIKEADVMMYDNKQAYKKEHGIER